MMYATPFSRGAHLTPLCVTPKIYVYVFVHPAQIRTKLSHKRLPPEIPEALFYKDILVSEAGLEPARLPIRPSNVFPHPERRSKSQTP